MNPNEELLLKASAEMKEVVFNVTALMRDITSELYRLQLLNEEIMRTYKGLNKF